MPFPSPGDLPDPRIELAFPALQADSLQLEPPGKPFHILIFFFLCFHFVMSITNDVVGLQPDMWIFKSVITVDPGFSSVTSIYGQA